MGLVGKRPGLVISHTGDRNAMHIKKYLDRKRLGNTQLDYSSRYARGSRYLIGTRKTTNSQDNIQEICRDKPEITDALAQLNDHFSDRFFDYPTRIKASVKVEFAD